MKGDVDAQLAGNLPESVAQAAFVGQVAAHGQLDARLGVRCGALQRDAPGEPMDHVNVQALFGHNRRHPCDLHGCEPAPQQRDHTPVLAGFAHPGFVLCLRHSGEMDLHAQIVPGKEQVLEHRRCRVAGGNLDQETQRQEVVDHGLADIEDVDRVRGQHLCQHGSQARAIPTGYID